MAENGPILLFGGTGMVGHNVLDLAAKRNMEIVAPTHAEVDLLDGNAVLEAIRRIGPSLIIHTAGRVGGIQANMTHPVAFLTENWSMGSNVVLAARAAGVRRLINLGSSCMYPKDRESALREEDLLSGALEPTNEAYAIAKSAVQRLAAYVSAEDRSFAYKTLVPCNVYGRYDAYEPSRSHLAAAVIQKLDQAVQSRAPSVDIWGDGTARREFVYAGDVADAILTAIERFDSLPAVMNVGPGVDHMVNEYYEIAAEVVGYRGEFTHDLSKPVGMKRKVLDVSLARQWGWQARTTLREGLAAAYDYYRTVASRFRLPGSMKSA